MTSPAGWHGVLGEWTLTPVSDALVLLAAVAYLSAARRRRRWHGARWPPWRAVCTLSGLAVIVLARGGAIGVSSRELPSAHVVQHLALMIVAPVLLAVGHPLTLVRESSAHGREIAEALRHNVVVAVVTHPLVAFAGYATVLVGTHLTGFPALAAAHPWLHEVALALYVLSGYLLAVSLVAAEPLWRQPSYPVRSGLVLLSSAVHTFVGIALMKAGDSPDQHLAGALMWFVGDSLMMVVALAVAGQWVVDRDSSARLVHKRVLAVLARPRPPNTQEGERDQ